MSSTEELIKNELEKLPALSNEEIVKLISKSGFTDEVKEAVVNGMQKRIFDAADPFATEKILKTDLYQEGNLALLDFIAGFHATAESFPEGAMNAVLSAMKAYAESESESAKAGEALKAKLNVIDEICVRIAEKTGREATAEEIAELLKTDADEIRYLMRIALSALEKEQ